MIFFNSTRTFKRIVNVPFIMKYPVFRDTITKSKSTSTSSVIDINGSKKLNERVRLRLDVFLNVIRTYSYMGKNENINSAIKISIPRRHRSASESSRKVLDMQLVHAFRDRSRSSSLKSSMHLNNVR